MTNRQLANIILYAIRWPLALILFSCMALIVIFCCIIIADIKFLGDFWHDVHETIDWTGVNG